MGRSFTLVLFILMLGMVIGLLYFTTTRSEAVECSSSTALTSRDIQSGTRCTSLDRTLLGIDGGFDAYAFLKTRLCPDKPEYYVTEMNPQFAKQLALLIKSSDEDVRITSGARRASDQQAAIDRCKQRSNCQLGRDVASCATCSNHTKGCAADLKVGGCSTNPSRSGDTHKKAGQFGLHFRMSWEPWHVEPTNRSYCTRGDGTNGTVNEDFTPDTSVPAAPSSPYSNPDPSGDLLDRLQQPTLPISAPGGGGNNFTNSHLSNALYTSDIEGGDAREFLQEEFIGDGAPAFESLLGEFGEFDEGEEVRDVLGYGENNGSAPNNVVSVTHTGTSTRVISPINPETGECTEGVAQTNIYGNIICVRDVPATKGETLDTSGFFFDQSLSDPGTGIARTVATLVDSIMPIRHLLGSTNTGGYSDTRYRLQAYDAYVPTNRFMYGADIRSGLTEEELVNFLVQEDLLEDEPQTQLSATVMLEILRPVLLHVVFALYGTGSYSMSALLNLAYTL